jgi:hypothetical protein
MEKDDKTKKWTFRKILKVTFDVVMIVLSILALSYILLNKNQKKMPDSSLSNVLMFNSSD